MICLQDKMMTMQVPSELTNGPHDCSQLSLCGCVELLSLVETFAGIRDGVINTITFLSKDCSHAFGLPVCLEWKGLGKVRSV